MHGNPQKSEHDIRGHRSELAPVDETSDMSKEEIATAIEASKEKSKLASGVVVNCLKLNVRKEPKTHAEIITPITALTEVLIDPSTSTSEFYKIRTSDGIEGFCVKKYIALKK